MLTYLWAKQLANRPLLRDSMFRDRANQFKTRLNGQVEVDQNGFEKDEYDALDPLLCDLGISARAASGIISVVANHWPHHD